MSQTSFSNIDRRELLPHLFPTPKDWLFIAGLAGAARDTSALTNNGPNCYALAGAMGAAVPIGLGVALSAPEHRVAVITGDGEMLMGIGALVTVAAAAPRNLTIVCLDNGMHGETGGQKGHTAGIANLEKMAAGAGIPATLSISEKAQIPAAAEFIANSSGLCFLHVAVMPTPPSAIKRDLDMTVGRLKFREFFQSKSN